MSEKKEFSAFSDHSVINVIEEMHEGLQIIDQNFCYLYINKAAVFI